MSLSHHHQQYYHCHRRRRLHHLILQKNLHNLERFVRTTVAKSKRVILINNTSHIVNVLTSNVTFLIFAVLVVRCSHCRPYKMF